MRSRKTRRSRQEQVRGTSANDDNDDDGDDDNDDDNHGNRRFVCVLNVVRYKEGCRAERPSAAAAPLLFHEIYVTF